jgi:hypothetical protein
MAAGIAALKATAQNNVLGWNLMVCSCFIGVLLGTERSNFDLSVPSY